MAIKPKQMKVADNGCDEFPARRISLNDQLAFLTYDFETDPERRVWMEWANAFPVLYPYMRTRPMYF